MPEPKPMLLILFGLPGAGKTYAGRLLAERFDFHLHESDDDIPEDYRQLVAAGLVVSDERRDEFHRGLLDRITALQTQHPRLAVAAPLLRHKHRLWIRDRFPQARFILVECPADVWQARLARRQHAVGADYALRVLPLYESPELEHYTLNDAAEGPAAAIRQLAAIVGELEA